MLEQLLPAFGVLSQGCLISTPDGPVAVEDLHLGDTVLTASGAEAKLIWTGEAMLSPGVTEDPWLRRVVQDRFGFARPASDMVLGRGAEIVIDAVSGRTRTLGDMGCDDTLYPVSPQASVRLFQIALDTSEPVLVNGLSMRPLCPSRFMDDKADAFFETFGTMMPEGSLPDREPRPWSPHSPSPRKLPVY